MEEAPTAPADGAPDAAVAQSEGGDAAMETAQPEEAAGPPAPQSLAVSTLEAMTVAEAAIARGDKQRGKVKEGGRDLLLSSQYLRASSQMAADAIERGSWYPERRREYRDRSFRGSDDEYYRRLQSSTTCYVGNMSFFTTEEQIWELFAQASRRTKPLSVRKITMGLNRDSRTPCGFCFVELHTRQEAEFACSLLSGAILDDRPIRVDMDWGFQEGRQFGRGRSGGQVRDEYRLQYDEGRGGFGVGVKRQREEEAVMAAMAQQQEHAAQPMAQDAGFAMPAPKRAAFAS